MAGHHNCRDSLGAPRARGMDDGALDGDATMPRGLGARQRRWRSITAL